MTRRQTVVTVISKIGDRRPKSRACLVVIHGQQRGKRIVVKPGEMLIGRSSKSRLQIDHESVSRRHAKIVVAESTVELSDMGSTNGTYVNDEPVTSRTLHDGDLVKVGRTILKYLSSDNIEAAYHNEIYHLNTMDGLTRCYNKRYFREQAAGEVSRSTRYKRPLSVVSFCIKDFDALCEEYGHLAGDAVLAQLGKRVSRRVRREDVFARTGPDEFAILSPECTEDFAIEFTKRLKGILDSTKFGFDDVSIPVTIAINKASLTEIDPEAAAATYSKEEDSDMDESTDTFDAFPTDSNDVHSARDADRYIAIASTLHNLARSRMKAE